MGSRVALAQLAAIAVVYCAGASAAPQAGALPAIGSESAVWTPKELSFLYQGVTAKYSCDGLRAKLRSVLLRLGAREDLELREGGCTSSGGPDPFPSVKIKMNVLQPAVPAAAGGAPAAVPAHWQTVNLVTERDPVFAAGDCELVEQIKQYVLPLFATRNVEYRLNCVPNQLQPGGARLRAEVLISDSNALGAPTAE